MDVPHAHEQEAKELKLSAATEAMAEAHARLDAATADSAELEAALKVLRGGFAPSFCIFRNTPRPVFNLKILF